MIAINYYTEWIYIDRDIASRGAHNSTEDSYTSFLKFPSNLKQYFNLKIC